MAGKSSRLPAFDAVANSGLLAADGRRRAVTGSTTLVLCALVLIALAACEHRKPRGLVDRAWTEDVRLDDGSSVRVRRTARLNITNSWAGDAYNSVEQEATLAFMGNLSGLPVWSAPRIALVLYRDHDTSEWTLVTTTTSCEIWELDGKPKPPYWEYRLKAEGWVAAPLSPVSIGRPANLLHIYDKQLPSNHITEVERQLLQSDRRIASQYREVRGDPDMYVCGEGDPNKPR
jgi:hypothetical protein